MKPVTNMQEFMDWANPTFVDCTLLTDPVRRLIPQRMGPLLIELRKDEPLQANAGIPVGEAHEFAFGGPSVEEMVYQSIGDAFKALFARDLGAKLADPNAAMISRDEPKTYSYEIDSNGMGYVIGDVDCKAAWLGGELIAEGAADWPFGAKSTAKPAIHGITTVHDGKARGIGFCSEIGDE